MAATIIVVLTAVIAVVPQVVRAEDMKTTASERRAAAKERLSDTKLKVCQNRETRIKHIMARIADRGQKQVNLFSSIAEKTQKFYTEKGRTVASYDTLVADVEAKKTSAQSAVDTIKSNSEAFVCTADDPRGMVSTFQDNLKAEIQALKAYKTSVKNLIVAVKSAQSTAASSTEGGE